MVKKVAYIANGVNNQMRVIQGVCEQRGARFRFFKNTSLVGGYEIIFLDSSLCYEARDLVFCLKDNIYRLLRNSHRKIVVVCDGDEEVEIVKNVKSTFVDTVVLVKPLDQEAVLLEIEK